MQTNQAAEPNQASRFFEPMGSWNGPLVEIDADHYQTADGTMAASDDDESIVIYWG